MEERLEQLEQAFADLLESTSTAHAKLLAKIGAFDFDFQNENKKTLTLSEVIHNHQLFIEDFNAFMVDHSDHHNHEPEE